MAVGDSGAIMDTRGATGMLAAIRKRHSVRMYTNEPVDATALSALRRDIEAVNEASGLHVQLGCGLNDAFMGCRTHYGRFNGVHNAVALIGPTALIGPAAHNDDAPDHDSTLELNVGYYGEWLALRIIELGLSTAWAVLDNADAGWWSTGSREHLIWVLAFGHGVRPGAKHHTKPMDRLCSVADGMQAPDWFIRGMQAAMLAPTSLGQQPFLFRLERDGTVSAEATHGLFSYVGLGCARRHFDIGAAPERAPWNTAIPRIAA